MNKFEKIAGTTKNWVKPELKRLNAGSAENSPTQGNPDGNTGGGAARNIFVS
jgi:hypothetical protein